MGSDKEDVARWADLVFDGKPINIDQTLRQQAATIADLREAVRVLAEEVSAWSTGNFATHQCQIPNGGSCTGCQASERRQKATEASKNNPIAAEAVRKAGG